MGRWTNVDLLLGKRRRRSANSKPTLGQRLMFAGLRQQPRTGHWARARDHDPVRYIVGF